MKIRPEAFGALVELESPPAIVAVNRSLARLLGVDEHPERRPAPLEAQLQLSRRCGAGCSACYAGATPGGDVMEWATARAAIDRLAEHGVFRVAFGGGEPLDVEWVFELAAYARARKVTPSLTTSGLGLTEVQAERCAVFSQVNVSLDGLGEDYRRTRGYDGSTAAVRALTLLRRAVPSVGLNCVVTRDNFPRLSQTLALAKRLRLNQVQLLRFKPVGRGAAHAALALSREQAEALWPRVRWLSLRHRMRVRLDCSFASMVFWHRPPRWLMEFFGVVGCAGGEELVAIGPRGELTGCGFYGASEASVGSGPAVDRALEHGFAPFRGFVATAPEPCASCAYLTACRGGCRAAGGKGDLVQPDPGCPRVARWAESRSSFT